MTEPEFPVALESSSLAITLTNRAIQELKEQRRLLGEFIGSILVEDSDYGIIPGTKKNTLFKPGAEKLANIFKLGSRIVSDTKDVDYEKGWANFTYRVEIFHIPTGHVIAQCEGSANSEEKKNKSRDIPDLLNTLQKMAQKRAFVGAVIMATGASDFFTHDLEDFVEPEPKPKPKTQPKPNTEVKRPELILTPPPSDSTSVNEVIKNMAPYQIDPEKYIIPVGPSKGSPLITVPKPQLLKYVSDLRKEFADAGKSPDAVTLGFIDVARKYYAMK